MSDREIVFRVQRFRPETDAAPRWQEYPVTGRPGMTVLEGLNQIRAEHDATLSWRHSCRMGICGSCAMLINGQPALACNTQVLTLGGSSVKLQPLANFRIIKDLVGDLAPMFDKHAALAPYVVRGDSETVDSGADAGNTEMVQHPEQVDAYQQFAFCIKCGACMSACPTLATDERFWGPMPLTAAERYNRDSRDEGFAERKVRLADSHAFSHCHFAAECSRVCPKGVDPARAIQLLKRDLVMDLFGLRKPARARPVAPATPSEPHPEVPRAPAFTVDPDR